MGVALFPATASGGTFALVQHVNNIACPSGTATCTIALTQSIAAGDLLIFEGTVSGNTLMTTTDNGGAFVPCVSCVGFDQSNIFAETSGGWILSAAPQSSAITVTFNAVNSGFVGIEMWEYSYSGGTVGFDGANQVQRLNTASPASTAFTPSGVSDISIQTCDTNGGACNAVTAPFLADNLGKTIAWAYLDTPAAWTTPTWTLASAGTTQLTQMAFGFDTKPCANTMFMDFSGTDGSAVDLDQLALGTFGWQGGQRFAIGTNTTFATSASHTLQNSTGRLCDGGDYTDPSTTGLQYPTGVDVTHVQINGTGGILTVGPSISAGLWYSTTVPSTAAAATDNFVIFGTNGQDYAAVRELGTGAQRFVQLACGIGESTGSVAVAPSTWFWVDLTYNTNAAHTLKVYSDTNPPVQLGSTLTCPTRGTVQPGSILLGTLNTFLPAGFVYNFDGLMVSLDGADPLLPTGPAPQPVFSPSPGTYGPGQAVTLSDAAPGAVMYYTTDGTAPTTNSPVYAGPIQLNSSTTIKAIAGVTGYNNSYAASGTYTIRPAAAAPIFSPAPGSYNAPQSVMLSDTTPGAAIYYTTDGSTPTTGSPLYSSAILVNATATIKAIALANGYSNSAVAVGTYTITLPTATPSFNPAPGSYSAPQSVTMADTTPGAVIYYTTNGTTPTTGSAVYGGPIQVNATTTIQAIALAPGFGVSAVVSGTYTISPGSGTVVNLSGYYNVYGIATVGTTPKSGGFDNGSYAYNSGTLGTTASYQGLTFTLGPANALDAISAQTVALFGQYNQLFLLGAGVNGNQTNQNVVVTYTDGTTSTFTQNFSDWAYPQSYSGESTVLAASNRVAPSGQTQALAVNVYGYTLNLTAGKTLQSVKLPSSRNVVFLGIGLGNNVSSGLRFIPVAPCRVADTRNANGPFGGPALAASSTRSFTIPSSACNIPSTALAYAMNFTVVPPAALGSISVWPTGQAQPGTILLASYDGRVKANAAIVAAGTSGGISVNASNKTHLVIDITGYFVAASNASGLAYYPVTPCRSVNPTFLPGGQARTFPIAGTCNIPSTAKAYAVNITVQPTSGPMNVLYAWPTGQSQPASSTLNAPTGTTVSNTAILGAGTNGQISLLPTNSTNVVVDITGYYAALGSGGLSLFPVPGCRAVSALTLNQTTTLNIAGSQCKVPGAARSYILNGTVVPWFGYLGNLVFWANGTSQPGTVSLVDTDGSVISNGAVVSTTNGYINVYSQNLTSLYVDINAYFAP